MKTVSAISTLCAIAIIVPAVQGQSALSQDKPRADRREISVTGFGSIKIVPDGLEFKIGVESDAPSVEAVRRDNDTKMNSLLKALKDTGVSEKDIVTTSLGLTKTFTPAETSQTKREGVNFKLNRDVKVRLKKVKGAEEVMAAAMRVGANKLSEFEFVDEKSTAHRDAAIDLAIADAIQRADRQSAKFGAKRGKVTWVAEDRTTSYYRGRDQVIVTGSMISGADIPAPISNGEISVDMSIYAQFELE
jgi:uncharacterized protein YggE